jgi:hypothetical protein
VTDESKGYNMIAEPEGFDRDFGIAMLRERANLGVAGSAIGHCMGAQFGDDRGIDIAFERHDE